MADEWLAWLKSNVLELIILILVLSIFINTFYGQAEKEISEASAAMEKPEAQEMPVEKPVEEPPTQTQEIAVTEPKAEEKSP